MTAPLRALIVDDERPARRWLADLLKSHPQIEVYAEADGIEQAREVVGRESPDVVFLDVQMPPNTGFDLLAHLPDHTRIVFVTAFDNYAVRAFEAKAIDYLLKPVHPERLAESLSRLHTAPVLAREPSDSAVSSLDDESAGAGRYSKASQRLELEDLLPLRDRGLLRMVPVEKIAAIRAEGAYTQVIIAGQDPILILQSIGDWEERLPSPPFYRLDRSRLLNLNRIRQANTIDRDKTLVTLDQVAAPFELGRSASRRLRELFR